MIWLILGIALFLRLISLNQSLWLDEAINVLAAKNYSLLGMISEYAKADFHPPGFFFILWIWTKLFGYSEVTVRAPSVIFGLFTVFIAYLIGKKLLSKNLGIIAALILTVNPLHIYYSQEARMYVFAAFVVSLSIYFFIKLLSNERLAWLGYVISSILVLSSDYLAYLIFPTQLVILILLKRFQFLKKWLVLSAVAVFAWIWWIPVFISQLSIGSQAASSIPGWREVVGSFGIKPLILTYIKFIIGRINYPNDFVYFLLFLIPGITFAYLFFKAMTSKLKDAKIILSLSLTIPILLAWSISFFIPIYTYFRVLFTLPFFILLVALGVLHLKGKLFKISLALLIAVQLASSLIYLLNAEFHRENWKDLVNFLKNEKEDSVVLFESTGVFSPFEYYADDSLNAIGALNTLPAETEEDTLNLENRLKGVDKVFLLQYLVEISDPLRLVEQKLANIGFEKSETYNFNGVGFVYKFER